MEERKTRTEKHNKQHLSLDTNTIVKYLLIFLICIGLIVAIYFVVTKITGSGSSISSSRTKNNKQSEQYQISDELLASFKETWQANKAINEDYVGNITFASGILDQPFVQSEDNDYYLRKDFEKNVSQLGTVFMDYECTLESQNIVLYGHNVYSYYNAGVDENGNLINNDTLMFSPLELLTEEENYSDNKVIYLALENEVRTYVIVSVFYVPLYENTDGDLYPQGNLLYYLPEYDEEYFTKYKENIRTFQFYKTGESMPFDDKYLTLQTCVEDDETAREVVLCKEVAVNEY